MERSDKVDGILPALFKFQGAVKKAIKASTNPHFGSKYADLADLDDVARGPLQEASLFLHHSTVTIGAEDKRLILETRIWHISTGQWMASFLPVLNLRPGDPQAQGSALTYSKRQNMSLLLNLIADADDDANKASGNIAPRQTNKEAINSWKSGARTVVKAPVKGEPEKAAYEPGIGD